MTPIKVLIGRQGDGCAYELHPESKARIAKAFPLVKQAPSVFLGYETKAEFEAAHGPHWKQVAIMLSGLTWSQLRKLGGVEIYDPTDHRVVRRLEAA
jgi:hypothetical protein